MRRLWVLATALLVFGFVLIPVSQNGYVAAQGTSFLWVKSFDRSLWDYAVDVEVAPDGDVIVLGVSSGDDAPGSFVLRLDPKGNVKWARLYWVDVGVLRAIELAQDGMVVVGSDEGVLVILKLDWNGGIRWWKRYRIIGGDLGGYDVAVAPNGDIVVGGVMERWFGRGSSSSAFILRLDSEGGIKARLSFTGEGSERIYGVSVAPNGDVIAVGSTDSFSLYGDYDLWVIRMDSENNIKWTKVYGGLADDYGVSVAVAPNGDILVRGYTWSFSKLEGIGRKFIINPEDWVLRLDGSGNVVWAETLGVAPEFYMFPPHGLSVASSGDIVIPSSVQVSGEEANFDGSVIRLDSAGNVKWAVRYGGALDDAFSSVAISPEGNIVVAGSTSSFLLGGLEGVYDVFPKDAWVLKLPENGVLPASGVRDNRFSYEGFSVTPKDTPVSGEDVRIFVGELEISPTYGEVMAGDTAFAVGTQYYLEAVLAAPQVEVQEEGLTRILTLSYLWSAWFFKYHDDFNSLYETALAMNVSNETLQMALELHNNATAKILEAWHVEDVEYIKQHLWKRVVFIPQVWNARRAFLLEKRAVEILMELIGA